MIKLKIADISILAEGFDNEYFIRRTKAYTSDFENADMSVSARVEYDCENDNLAYADLNLKHKLNDRVDYYAKYVVRDFRWWDYSSTPYDSTYMRRDEFNWVDYQYFEIGCEQGTDVSAILLAHGFTKIRVLKDLAGLDRVVCATLAK